MTIALETFGTGYSSLAHLSELPVDKIKIDRSFERRLHRRAASAKIVGAVVGAAQPGLSVGGELGHGRDPPCIRGDAAVR